MEKRDAYPILCLAIYLVVFVLGAIKPWYFGDWALESVLPLLVVLILVLSYRAFRFSNLSYTLFLAFIILHTIGSHYTYANMPLGRALSDFLGFQRNYYDRIVHFFFGVLIYYPVFEFFKINFWKTKYPRFSKYLFTLFVVMLAGVLFELFEGLANFLITDSELIAAYLATQGQILIFDSLFDLLMKFAGGLIIMAVIFLINRRKQEHPSL